MKISCCSNFNNPVFFGPHLYSTLNREIFKNTILIHGYHSPEKEAESSYAEIEKRFNGEKTIVEYYWPGGAISIDFPLAVERATMTGWRLRDLLVDCLPFTIDVQTHSLGARVILEAVKYGFINLGHLILTAPAVNNDCFDKGGEFEEVPKWCKSVNVFYSSNDPVLKNDYPLSPTNFGRVALGHSGPIGIIPNNLKKFDYSSIINTHGGYRFNEQYFKDWESIVS